MATPAQLAEKARQDGPPPLPPRGNSFQPPPPYSAADARRSAKISEQWQSQDPRSSSTQSLVPSESGRDGRRTLLLVYIHGFMGNELSFQSFPAHLHNLLTITLAETHVVHTKIYPRYKSRRVIEFARDDFSTWLEPHEYNTTDVILLGHSIGGILAAEVALQPPFSPTIRQPLRHRILGTVSFDTPFLGMHPGVVFSGIESLFRTAPLPLGSETHKAPDNGFGAPSMEGLSQTSSASYAPSAADSEGFSQASLVQSITSPSPSQSSKDPYFDPPFPNDVRLPERKGWSNLLHFINKHSDGLTSATTQYFMSHLEFGGCLADYQGLKNRYQRLRALEDIDELSHGDGPSQKPAFPRIRFANYYTASTGRPKPPKIPPGQMIGEDGNLRPIEAGMEDINLHRSDHGSPLTTPSISVEEYVNSGELLQMSDEELTDVPLEKQIQNLGKNSGVQDDFQEPMELQHVDSIPIDDDEEFGPMASIDGAGESEFPTLEDQATSSSEPALPAIPPMPTEPDPIDVDSYRDKDSRKIAEKDQKRAMKAYQQALKDRESAIKDRRKLVEKRQKKSQLEQDKQLKVEQKQRMKEEKEEEKRRASINPPPTKERTGSAHTNKPKKDKKFCILPPETGGKRDKCWIRVYMEGVDEVGAHCGLFTPGPQYESLVGDVGARIEQWVKEDLTTQAVLAAERA